MPIPFFEFEKIVMINTENDDIHYNFGLRIVLYFIFSFCELKVSVEYLSSAF